MSPDQVRQLALEVAEKAVRTAARSFRSGWVDGEELGAEDVAAVREELENLAEWVATS